jgi:uncharacterized protein with HEPN domain
MSERDESVYVRHMLDAVARLNRHAEGVDRDAFLADEMIQDAIIRQLEILGEAAGRVSRDTCARYAAVPWTEITGLRHRLIHDYLGVDLPLIWRVVQVEIPRVIGSIESMLGDLTGA